MIQHISHTVATMSKVKAKKADSSAKTQRVQTAEKNSTAKQKRKQWMKEKFRKKKLHPKDQQKANAQQTVPPKDAQQFSANWKTLQEMLKVSQEDKKTVHQPKQQNGDLLKKGAEESSSKTLTKNDVSPGQTDTGKKWKHKTLSNNSVTEDPQVKVTEPGQAAAPKRKRDDGIRVSEKTAKKKSSAVEERKPTEDDLWFDDVDPDDVEATMGAEAADIMRKMQGVKSNINKTESSLVKDKAFEGLTRAVAIDCEMVGVGPDGEDSILARVSLVNQFGKCIYDKHVKPTEKVTDYRTAVSGIRPKDIREGEDVQTVQKEVAEILEGRIVVGHAIHNDLKILLLDHPKKKIRDTQKYKPFRKTVKSNRPSLKVLCREILNVNVQQGEHSSVQDAQATMRLYTLEKKQWEAEIKASQKNKESDRKFDRKPRFPKNKDKKLIGR